MYYEDHGSEWIPFSRYKYRVTTENKAGEVRSTWKRITTAEGIPENVDSPKKLAAAGLPVQKRKKGERERRREGERVREFIVRGLEFAAPRP